MKSVTREMERTREREKERSREREKESFWKVLEGVRRRGAVDGAEVQVGGS